MLPGVVLSDEVREIPSIYLKPEFHSAFADYPLVVDNGYISIDNIEIAKKFIEPLPPDLNLDSERAIVFAWHGSDQDKIIYDQREDIYHFVYKKGMSDNMVHHIKIIIVPKKNDWLFHRVIE